MIVNVHHVDRVELDVGGMIDSMSMPMTHTGMHACEAYIDSLRIVMFSNG